MSNSFGTTKTFLRTASSLICLLLSQHGQAEQKTTAETAVTGNDYEYKFDDDDLLGNSLANSGDMFCGRARFRRVLLLRPRTDLRPQMYKSVENL